MNALARHQPASDPIRELRAALWAAGYRPVPVKTGQKAPFGTGWPDEARRNPPACVNRPSSPSALSTGALSDGLRIIDIDVEDASIADQVEGRALELLGRVPVRYRHGTGKRALPYRAAIGEPGKVALKGKHGQVEVLGLGQQIVVDGTHPSGMPYLWRTPDGEPMAGLHAVPRDTLPAVTEEAVQALLNDLAIILGVEAQPAPEPPKAREMALPPSGDVGSARLQAAARKALDEECAKLAATGSGRRNDCLNATAFRLGRFVAGGFSRIQVEIALQRACVANGLWKDDPSQCRKTIASGLESGIEAGPVVLGEREREREAIDLSGVQALISARGEDEAPGQSSTPAFTAEPFIWKDPSTLDPRQWIYGGHYIRKFLSATVAAGGVGKSALTMCEGIAIATGRDLLGVKPAESVPVWLINYEDPKDELERRIGAIALHYGLGKSDLERRLFVNSGRTTPCVIAETSRDGFKIMHPVAATLIAQIRENGIGLLIIDPFVASHRVPENDNSAVNAVVSEWRKIADETGIAVELVHHIRKTGGHEATVEDARGGAALHGGVRSMRVLNPMNSETGDKLGVENHRQYFNVDNGKRNLVPMSVQTDWFKIVSVDLGNWTTDRPSDHVGVVTAWKPPSPLEGITASHVKQVQSALLANPNCRFDQQASDWVGHLVGTIIGADTGPGLKGRDLSPIQRAARSQVRSLVQMWIANGALRKEERQDEKRMTRIFVVAGDVDDEDFSSAGHEGGGLPHHPENEVGQGVASEAKIDQ